MAHSPMSVGIRPSSATPVDGEPATDPIPKRYSGQISPRSFGTRRVAPRCQGEGSFAIPPPADIDHLGSTVAVSGDHDGILCLSLVVLPAAWRWCDETAWDGVWPAMSLSEYAVM